jgi:hypothetical protein
VLISASGEGSTNPGRHSAICLNALNGQVMTNIINSRPTYDIVATTVGGAFALPITAMYGIGFNGSGNTTWNYDTGTLNAVWSMKRLQI